MAGYTAIMAGYTAIAVSEGDHWVIDVPGVGSTQADSVETLEERTRDLVVAMTRAAPEDVHIDLRIV